MRTAIRRVRAVWAGIVITVLVPILIGRVLGFTLSVILNRRRTRAAFRRSLRRAGMSPADAEDLARRYHARVPFRGLVSWRH